MRKIIALGIMLLFIGMTISSSTGLYVEKQTIKPICMGNILYVGGSGEGNYTNIQDAINDSSDGDTVYVYDDSSPYFENVVVNKSINLIGEDKNTTIIDGGGTGNVVKVTADCVYISAFTIRNSGVEWDKAGIKIFSNHNTVIGSNISSNNNNGIWLASSYDNNIKDNTISSNNEDGIFLQYSRNNTITSNLILNNKFDGIHLFDSSYNNNIKDNTVSLNNGHGIHIDWNSGNNIVNGNNIISNNCSIFVDGSSNIIIQNNFLNNEHDASFYIRALEFIFNRNRWRRNYWNESRVFPKPIFGKLWWPTDMPSSSFRESISWFQFDWHPAQEPYDIGV